MPKQAGYFNANGYPEPMPEPVLRCPYCGVLTRVSAEKIRARGFCERCPRSVSTPGDWWDEGNCKEPDDAPTEVIQAKQALFFREQGRGCKEAMAICHGCTASQAATLGFEHKAIAPCPVINQCRDYAVREAIPHGVWGGTTERERRRLRAEWRNRQKIRQEPPDEEYPAAVAGAS